MSLARAALLSLCIWGCTNRETAPPAASHDVAATQPAPSQQSGFAPSAAADPSVDSNGCSDASKLVYVLSLEGDLYSFAPADKKFTKIGALNCGAGATPISMAVDRNAVAWVNERADTDTDGHMFKVDTHTAACTPTSISGEWGGMGFSSKPGSPLEETLFVVGPGSVRSSALTRVDLTAQKLLPVADWPDSTPDLELTGTGDGRLYGFMMSSPLALSEIDQDTGAIGRTVQLPQIEMPASPMYAFSFWGGDFYFYTATDESPSRTTNVARYRPSDGSVDAAYMTNIGFHIVGAGVSTCAPTTSPK
jgi:hypothetical protein